MNLVPLQLGGPELLFALIALVVLVVLVKIAVSLAIRVAIVGAVVLGALFLLREFAGIQTGLLPF
jgi:uncharacterized membrane protein YqjE